jgi:hypothetical protein
MKHKSQLHTKMEAKPGDAEAQRKTKQSALAQPYHHYAMKIYGEWRYSSTPLDLSNRWR